ncbi:uncharacterized protein LY79DRAFT_321067 [Colletotrichum navitas]|uniref:Uncharacterized protein n=1 Tax=Colletotrichum navitas TaxID=681940 RepID=A0AAD8QA93_9PEZI|nr:uncharacterized protein LY79DRAFT_321067 [Colletotrichum navitas]KAK1597897.1 hypothetical protein LY79DRAFT_321067 [Colletotrichum navitas]
MSARSSQLTGSLGSLFIPGCSGTRRAKTSGRSARGEVTQEETVYIHDHLVSWGHKEGTAHPKFGFSAQGVGKDEQKETGKEKRARQMFRPESMNVAAGGSSQTSIKQTKTLTCTNKQAREASFPFPVLALALTHVGSRGCCLSPDLFKHVRPCTHPASVYRLLARPTSG